MLAVDIDGSLVRAAESTRQSCVVQIFLLIVTVSSIIAQHPERAEDKFPYNLTFRTENFVEATHTEQFDTILWYHCFFTASHPRCSMSVTKWIQLNWGDAGLRKLFANVDACLRPGGFFLLEPQEFSSYKRRSRLTEEIKANFKSLQIRPKHFADYLALEFGYELLTADSVIAGQKGATPFCIAEDSILEQDSADLSIYLENLWYSG